jgi:hypothetical protein
LLPSANHREGGCETANCRRPGLLPSRITRKLVMKHLSATLDGLPPKTPKVPLHQKARLSRPPHKSELCKTKPTSITTYPRDPDSSPRGACPSGPPTEETDLKKQTQCEYRKSNLRLTTEPSMQNEPNLHEDETAVTSLGSGSYNLFPRDSGARNKPNLYPLLGGLHLGAVAICQGPDTTR